MRLISMDERLSVRMDERIQRSMSMSRYSSCMLRYIVMSAICSVVRVHSMSKSDDRQEREGPMFMSCMYVLRGNVLLRVFVR